mgnify:CR=1 FL=1
MENAPLIKLNVLNGTTTSSGFTLNVKSNRNFEDFDSIALQVFEEGNNTPTEINLDESEVNKVTGQNVMVSNLNSDKNHSFKLIGRIGEVNEDLLLEDENYSVKTRKVTPTLNSVTFNKEYYDKEGMAKVTDDANFARHLKKMNLQKAHFDNDLTEVKNR